MTRNRVVSGAVLVVALIAYTIGPRLLAPQSDRAADRCADTVMGDVSSVTWQVIPVAGWVCRDDNGGTETYLAWWA